MNFYDHLRAVLQDKLPKNILSELPRSYFLLGHIVMIKLSKKSLPYKRKIGKSILKVLPYALSVAVLKSITGSHRAPKIEIVAGSRKTITVHKEYGCSFALDASKIMWSKGNKGEKLRLLNLASPRETVIDMFAGIGYFSIPLAKHKKADVHAIDINPLAVKFLKKNVLLNGIADKVKVYNGDAKKIVPKLCISPDRIIMGYFPAHDFFESALKASREGTVIHFHDTATAEYVPARLEKLKGIAARNGKFLDVLDVQQVKSYAPHIWHYVYDLKVV